MSADAAPSIYVVAPGGRSATGGMCRMVDYTMAEWEAAGRLPRMRLVDSTGPYIKWRQPFHFASALGRVLTDGLRGRIALLHIHAAERGSVLRKALFIHLADLLGVPSVIHMHAAGFEAFYGRAPGFVRRAVTRAFRKASRFIVLGGETARYFVETVGLDRDRVAVVRNAVPDPDATLGALSGTLSGTAWREPHAVCHLAFVGALIERKGLAELIAALAHPQMPDQRWHLNIAGNGDPAPWRKLAEQHGVADRVTFHGWLDSAGVQRLLAVSDALVLPSWAEGLPMVVIEAMAHGLPVVCTPVGAVREAVEDGATGLLVPPGDPASLAHALARLVRSPALRRRLGQAGRQRYVAEFGIVRLNDRLEGVFAEALHGRRPAIPATARGTPAGVPALVERSEA
jgi:glycosyltransferase involved in cell wall biosynthesis